MLHTQLCVEGTSYCVKRFVAYTTQVFHFVGPSDRAWLCLCCVMRYFQEVLLVRPIYCAGVQGNIFMVMPYAGAIQASREVHIFNAQVLAGVTSRGPACQPRSSVSVSPWWHVGKKHILAASYT